MKKNIVSFGFLLTFIIMFSCGGNGGSKSGGTGAVFQSWIRESNIPVFSSQAGDWDGTNIRHISVIFEGIYMMWYSGAAPDFQTRIGHATSSDSIVWTRYQGNNCPDTDGNGCVFEKGSSTAWDSDDVFINQVLMDGNAPLDSRFKMWYTGVDNKILPEDRKWRAGYATSPDGIVWTRYRGNNCPTSPEGDGCVFDTGSAGSWDDAVIGTSDVIIDYDAPTDERYKMWYEGCIYDGTPVHPCKIGYATSPDGITWTRYSGNNCPTGLQGDGCVFDIGDNGSWDSSSVFQPVILKTPEGQYEMWYAANSQLSTGIRIGYATSPDGITWTRYPGNNCPTDPLGNGCVFDIGVSGNWDDRSIKSPSVLRISGRHLMWYLGKEDKLFKVGLAYLN